MEVLLLYSKGLVNPLAYTAACEAVWAIDDFAFSSSFLPVDGMACVRARKQIWS
jgi:hypothetical protein